MSLSCYGLCYHNSNKKNFKSILQSCQPEVNYGRYDVVSILRVSLEVRLWPYQVAIGTGPLTITIGTIRSASGLDASGYAEALPTLSLSPKASQGTRQLLSDLQPVSVLSSSSS